MDVRIAGPNDEPPDAVLVDRYLGSHDQAAFVALIERHRPRVLAVCRRVLRHHHDAEDVCQATFLVLAREAKHLRRRESLAGWLYKIAYHFAVKLRAAADRQRHWEPLPSALPAEPNDGANDEFHRELIEELGRLPDHYRVPLLLCGVAGRTREQAAGHLGWTSGTLKMQLERGRQLLRARLTRR